MDTFIKLIEHFYVVKEILLHSYINYMVKEHLSVVN